MLTHEDYLEATKRFKDKKRNAHERLRCHALLLLTKGYTYSQTADILFLDEDTIRQWLHRYQEQGLEGLKNHPLWGGEQGQRWLTKPDLTRLSTLLETEAQPGTEVGSGWTLKAIGQLIEERFSLTYSARGIRKILYLVGWTYQRGRKLYIRRSLEEEARFELETCEILKEFAKSGARLIPLAGDQSKVYLEGTISRRWNRLGKQPLIADGARSKQAENIYGALHLGSGKEVATLCIDWQDSGATIAWMEMILKACPRGQIVLWIDGARHHTSDEVQEWLEGHQRLRVIHFPAYQPEKNPKERTWKTLKEEVSHHRWHASLADLEKAVDKFYQSARQHTVSFLERFGYFWKKGRIHSLPQIC
jgi:transposase